MQESPSAQNKIHEVQYNRPPNTSSNIKALKIQTPEFNNHAMKEYLISLLSWNYLIVNYDT